MLLTCKYLLTNGINMKILKFITALLIMAYAQWSMAFLPIQHWETPNGVKIYFVETHDLPILDISINFAAGSSTDTAETSGRAQMVQHLMSLGAGKMSEDQIAET